MEMKISGRKISFTLTAAIAILLANCAHRSNAEGITFNVALNKDSEKYQVEVSKVL